MTTRKIQELGLLRCQLLFQFFQVLAPLKCVDEGGQVDNTTQKKEGKKDRQIHEKDVIWAYRI